MGLLKKAAALGAVAAVGALATNPDKVKKAVRGLLGQGKRADKAIESKADKKAAKKAAKKAGKKARRKARKAARASA